MVCVPEWQPRPEHQHRGGANKYWLMKAAAKLSVMWALVWELSTYIHKHTVSSWTAKSAAHVYFIQNVCTCTYRGTSSLICLPPSCWPALSKHCLTQYKTLWTVIIRFPIWGLLIFCPLCDLLSHTVYLAGTAVRSMGQFQDKHSDTYTKYYTKYYKAGKSSVTDLLVVFLFVCLFVS